MQKEITPLLKILISTQLDNIKVMLTPYITSDTKIYCNVVELYVESIQFGYLACAKALAYR